MTTKRENLIQQIVESLIKSQRLPSPSAWEALGLSRAQVGMVYMLFYHHETNVKEVAQYLGISKSAASQLLDPLVDKGLVSRHPDARDRRVVRLSLTPQGDKLVKKLNKFKYAGIRSALDTLSEAELRQMAELHRKMADKAQLLGDD